MNFLLREGDLRPEKFGKPVMGLVGGVTVLDAEDQSDDAGATATVFFLATIMAYQTRGTGDGGWG